MNVISGHLVVVDFLRPVPNFINITSNIVQYKFFAYFLDLFKHALENLFGFANNPINVILNWL